MSLTLSFSGLRMVWCAPLLLALAGLPLPAAGQAVAAGGNAPAAGAAAPAGSVGGMGDINLYPKRVVIDGRQRIATVGLYNKTANSGDYEIAIRDMMMTPDGQIIVLDQVDDPAERAKVQTASAMLRWSPRRITLHANEAQTVRIMARTPPDLPPGEYRSHFMAIAVPPPDDAGFSIDRAAGAGSKGDIGVTIRPRFGISIPVIVRVGETTLETGLTGAAFVDLGNGRKGIAVTITRSGTRSAYGDMTATIAGTKTVLAAARGIGVYPEISSRAVTLAIDPALPEGAVTRGTRIVITYVDDDHKPGQMLARLEFAVP